MRRLNSFHLKIKKKKISLKFLIPSLFFQDLGFYTVEFVVLNMFLNHRTGKLYRLWVSSD